MLIQDKQSTIEEVLGCSLLLDGPEVFKALKQHYNSVEWSRDKPKRKAIFMLWEIKSLKTKVKITGHELYPDGSLELNTDHGTMKFRK